MHMLSDIIGYIGWFGGISAIILASGKVRINRMQAERQIWQQPSATSDPAVLEELKAMRKQMEQMQSTAHEFDISFDAALNRLEERVNRVETKVAVTPSTLAQTEEVQRVGLR